MAGDAARRRATYEDLLAAPDNMTAQIIDGILYTHPQPALRHQSVASNLGEELGPPFKRGRGGPGGWLIMDEPELHLGDDVFVPDLAGWRRERLPHVAAEAYATVSPDWLCEVLSPSTQKFDRATKLPAYAGHAVKHVWIIDPTARTLEILRREGGGWLLTGTHQDDARVRAEPFDAIELDLAILWSDLASE